MFTYGSQVNPALLRQDFSPIAQGAQALAQGTANAAQIRAQGMANMGARIGEGISEGFKSYIQNREKNSILEGKNAGMLRAMEKDPVLNADPDFIKLKQKQEKQGGLNFADNSKMNALLTTYSEQGRMRAEEQRQRDYLKLQQDAAAINAARAEREKAEYERKNKFQTGIISALQKNPDALKDPDAAAQLAVSLGGNFEDLSSIQGLAMSRDNFERNKQLYQLDLTDRNLRIAEAVQRRDLDGKGDLLEVQEQGGVKVVIGKDRFGNPTTYQVIKDEKASQGAMARNYAMEYAIADAKGDGPGKAKALIDFRATIKGSELMGDEVLLRDYLLPLVPNAGAAAPTEPLKVTGAPRPASATPAPTAEAARVTQPQTPTEAVPSATPPQLGRTFAPMAGAAPFEAPATAQPAPAAAPAPASPAIQYPPVQDTVIDDGALSAYVSQMGKRRPIVDIDAESMLSPELGARIQNINQYGGGSGALRNINLGGPPSARSQPMVPPSIDAETRAMSEAVRSRAEAPLPFDRYRLPESGALPQIKLSPAAQKIASELRRAASAGERGKAPEFFLEASTGDNGKRTRVKLGKNELFAILTNNPMPNLSPTLEVDREETRRLMDQQMRMNELMRQYRPPARRAR